MNDDSIDLLILDVDGVLTDGRLLYGADGEVVKQFHVQDGAAVKLWQSLGFETAILSGRTGRPVYKRAEDLGIRWVITGENDKLSGYESILQQTERKSASVAYVGDDLPDVPPMRRCALPIAVANARPAVKRAAKYVTRRLGGHGAVAEVIEFLLRRNGRPAVEKVGR